MTRAGNFIENAKSKHGHRSAMSISAWCDLNKNCTVLSLHDIATIQNVIVKRKLLPHHNNSNSKELVSKIL